MINEREGEGEKSRYQFFLPPLLYEAYIEADDNKNGETVLPAKYSQG